MDNVDRPKLVASDVDGTLLDPLERVTPRTAGVVGRVVAAGVPFVLVSGRPPRWIPPVARAAGLTGYAVCANGATVYDIASGEALSVHDLAPVVLHDVTHAVRGVLPDIRVATERTSVGPSPLAAFATEPGFRNPWGNPNGMDGENPEVPTAEVLGHPATKLMIRHSGLTSQELAAAVLSVLDGAALEVTYSTNRGLIEVSAAGVTKATGLAEVCAMVDVPSSRVVAFGDMPNDVHMLRWAGHGVAMANAHHDVLAAADEVTAPNSEDGVAQVLERWF
ncbi:HAD family hydrolase [Actinophytocola sp.]|jgi:hydroxymethylpyrimidine pyrophosphatase-like HAD family hydrolase|uniref:HAD family hydrolase n=1 Tax=Actinophytocola sp. TaxID=1872138 RepID=UPI002ED8DD97